MATEAYSFLVAAAVEGAIEVDRVVGTVASEFAGAVAAARARVEVPTVVANLPECKGRSSTCDIRIVAHRM